MPVVCPQCSAAIEQSTWFCIACGFNLQDYIDGPPVCPLCKTIYPEGSKFCQKDGSKLVSQADLVPRCMTCGRVYEEGTSFCPVDGGKIIYQASQPHQQSAFYGGVVSFPKASLGKRFVACLIDGLIALALAIPAFICFIISISDIWSLYSDEDARYRALALFLYILPLMYSLLKDGLGKGQSWGKRPFGLMVVNLQSGAPCDMGKSALRNLVSGLVSLIPFVGWLVEPIMVLVTLDGRKLGDKAANTQVIEKEYFT